MSEPTALKVLTPGLYTLVVDRGRPGARGLGLPVGGAADRFALALGNALVNNAPDAAALEVTLAGPTLEALGELACVLYGAPFELASDRHNLPVGTTFTLRPGERLRIGGCPRRLRAYLCVGGGIRTPVVLGSRSGLQPLRAGDELPCVAGTILGRSVRVEPDAGAGGAVATLHVLAGAQADWFPADGFLARAGDITGPRFTVSPASNRMGLRLRGQPLPLPERELVSEPVCPGTVQVARDGQCIVLGVDGQTIGGYPKIAQVIGADLDRVGQLRPGEEIAFVAVSLEEAVQRYRHRRTLLREWVTRLGHAEW